MRLKGYSGKKLVKKGKLVINEVKRLKYQKVRYFEVSSSEGGITRDILLNDKNLILTISLLL